MNPHHLTLFSSVKRHGDAWSFNFSELVEEGGRLYKHRTFFTVAEYLDRAKASPAQAR